MRHLRASLPWVAVVVLAFCFSRSVQAQDAFSGGWQVKCTPSDSTLALGASAFDDGFLFENSEFNAQAYAGLGFTSGAYSIDSTGKFTVTLASEDRGSVRWSGRIGNGGIYGWITWTKPDGSVFKYTYIGSAVSNSNEAG